MIFGKPIMKFAKLTVAKLSAKVHRDLKPENILLTSKAGKRAAQRGAEWAFLALSYGRCHMELMMNQWI